MKPSDIQGLPSEAVNSRTAEFSRLPTEAALYLMNAEDALVVPAVRLVVPQVALATDAIAARLASGGRLFYVGAGTSGRLGVLDASECPPTFGVEPTLVQGLIAGGREAVFKSREGAEDSPEGGRAALEDVQVTAADAVVGLAASGRTPYVLGALEYARAAGAFTAGISVNPEADMAAYCDVFIAPVVGPEVLAGSTRLKAGTAQKLIVNMISTTVMARLGFVEGNRMTHLRLSCEKLVARARHLVMDLTGADESTATAALERHGGAVWAAVGELKGNSNRS